jgi:MFS family permease
MSTDAAAIVPPAEPCPPIDEALKRSAIRKAILRIIPLMAFSYFISILDKSNISFAALQMNADLGIGPEVFGLAAGIFYVGYTLLEVPSNVLLVRFGARRWITRIMVTWGLLSMATALAQGPASLVTLRLLLGFAEAGLFPGMIYYLSNWFPRSHTGRILGMLFVLNPIAGAVGAPLSTAILEHLGWKAMFVIEGAPALVAAFLVWRYLPSSAQDVYWLSDGERRALLSSLDTPDQHGAMPFSLRATCSPSNLIAAAQLFLLLSASYGVQLWLPQIVALLDVPLALTGWVVTIPFALSTIAMIAHGWSSDLLRERFWHLVVPSAVAACVFALAMFDLTPGLAMTAISIGTAAIFCSVQAFFAYPRPATAGASPAVTIAFINSLGAFGGFVGPVALGFVRARTASLSATMLIISALLVVAALMTIARRQAVKEQLPSALDAS